MPTATYLPAVAEGVLSVRGGGAAADQQVRRWLARCAQGERSRVQKQPALACRRNQGGCAVRLGAVGNRSPPASPLAPHTTPAGGPARRQPGGGGGPAGRGGHAVPGAPHLPRCVVGGKCRRSFVLSGAGGSLTRPRYPRWRTASSRGGTPPAPSVLQTILWPCPALPCLLPRAVVYNNRGALAGGLAPLGSLLEKLCKLELENEPGPGATLSLLCVFACIGASRSTGGGSALATPKPCTPVPWLPPALPRSAAALKERIGRLLAAVLPVATSGRESRGGGSGYTPASTVISIRNRPSEAEAAADSSSKKKGGWARGWGGGARGLGRRLGEDRPPPTGGGPPAAAAGAGLSAGSAATHTHTHPTPPSLVSLASLLRSPTCPRAAPVVADLQPDPSAPAAAAYPSTLPAAAALFGTPEATRYAHFLEQLQVRVVPYPAARFIMRLGRGRYAPSTPAGVLLGIQLQSPLSGMPPQLMIAVPIPCSRPQAAAWQDDDAAAGTGSAGAAAAGGETAVEDPAAELGGLPSLLQLTGLLAGEGRGAAVVWQVAGGWVGSLSAAHQHAGLHTSCAHGMQLSAHVSSSPLTLLPSRPPACPPQAPPTLPPPAPRSAARR